jgi:predicted permease
VAELTVLNAYFIRPLPYPSADRLYSIQYAPPGVDPPANLRSLDWSTLSDVVEHPIAWDLDMFYLMGDVRPERAPGAWVTPGFNEAFGMRPIVGRVFETADFDAGAPQVALISHRLWQNRFGSDPAVVGRRFEAYVSDRPDEAESFTIVGVLPADVWHVNPYTEVLVPLRGAWYPYMVRLREGIPSDMAAERLTALVRSASGQLGPDWRVALPSVQESYVAEMRPVVIAIGVAIGLVLLIACANVAVLLLVGAHRRAKDVAVRMSLGASRTRIARLLAVEALLLGGVATVIGLAGGGLLTTWVGPIIESQVGRRAPGGLAAFDVDATVVFGAIVFGLICSCAFTLAPLLAWWRTSLSLTLARGGRGGTDAAGPVRGRSLLVVLEVAASLALLTGSALLVESARRMLQVDFGIRTEQTLMASVGLRERSYPDVSSRITLLERLTGRLSQIPGVESVALNDAWPFLEPRPRAIEALVPGASVSAESGVIGVSGGYFETLGIPIRQGRVFTSDDRAGSDPVVVISETLARRLWPDRSAIGERISLVADEEGEAAASPHVIVGVVADVRQLHADQDLADLYVPLLQRGSRFVYVYAAVSGPSLSWEEALWSAIADVDPELSMGPPRILQTLVDEELSRPRFLASLLTAFAAFSALLALLGMYGVIAYGVRQREREIAVRMALGANVGAVTRLVLREGVMVLAGGLALGWLAARAVGSLLQSQLYGIQAGDRRLQTLTMVVFAVCGLVAMWWPARRAAAADPASVLKSE